MHKFEGMSRWLLIILLVIATLRGIGQGVNLVPVDSANFEIISDSLFDRYSFIDWKFDSETYKHCPCTIDTLDGIISYYSSSFSIKSNRCIFIYKSVNDYFVRVGQVTHKDEETGRFIWEFTTNRLEDKTAINYISIVKNEISKAEVPTYETLYIVHDGVSFTFGDIEKNIFATTPITDFSESLEKTIKLSQKIIRKNI